MPNIGMGELAVCFLLIVAVAGVVALVLGRRGGLTARCPLCTSSIARRAVVCPNCKRDLPAGWTG